MKKVEMIEKLKNLELELINGIGEARLASEQYSNEPRFRLAHEIGYLSSVVKQVASELREIHSKNK